MSSEITNHENPDPDANMQAIFDNSSYAMLIIADGVVIEANEAAVQLFNARMRSEIIGKTPAILSPLHQPDGRSSGDLAHQIIQRALTGSHEVFEWTYQNFEGTSFITRVDLKVFEYLGKSSIMVVIEDITTENSLKKELEISRKNMQTIIDTTPYAMLIITDEKFVEVNNAAISLFGAKNKNDLVGKPPGIISPAHQADGRSSDEAGYEVIKRAMTGSVESLDCIHQKLDGTLMDCHVTLAGIEYNGKPSLMTIVQDLTEQRKQQNEVRIAQKNMQTIIDTTPYAMLIITDGIFVDVNNAAISLFGAQNRNDLVGKQPGIISPAHQVDGRSSDEAGFEVIKRAMAGSVESLDCIHQKLDGTLMDCHVTLAGIEYNGKPSLMTIVQDLTEQRKQQKEIIHLKQRTDEIIEKNPALMLIFNSSLQIIKINQALVDISGYSKEQLLSMKLSEFTISDLSGASAKDVLTTGKSGTGNLTLHAPKGILHMRHFYIPLLDQNGNIDSYLTVFFDETYLRNLQIKLNESISEVGRVLSMLAMKDLTTQASISTDDPLKEVKEDLNKTVVELREVLSEMLSDSETLLSSIKDINHSTDDLAQASNDVADTSQHAADDISQQSNQLQTISNEVSDLSASIEEIAASAADVRDITKKVSDSGIQAQHQGSDATRQMKIVEEISGTSVEQIRGLNMKMQEIGKIVKLISDIASQTNLLALNAAIEAARAGEAGRGFAVVAGEVKNLAGESRQATSNIEEVINGLMSESNKTAESIEKSYTTIIAGIEAVNATIEGLDKMVADINVASNSVSEISRATDSQAVATTRVNQNIEIVREMVVTVQDKMDSLSANAEESSAATEEIASASAMIVDMVEKLQHKIGEFTV
ncbi:MAG: PAS domain-containing protein [Methanomicrobiales archaeon]|nr:PAS domain-containing protein [Methanomicrobiales archaeon]